MKMELIQPFINAADAVLSQGLQGKTKVDHLTMEEQAYRQRGVAGLIALSGDIQGRVILDILRASGTDHVEFADDQHLLHGPDIHGACVRGSLETALQQASADTGFIVALGHPGMRLSIAARIREAGRTMLNAIHPSAVVMGRATMGVGNMIGATAVVNSGACLGNHVIVNTGAVVEHDCILEDACAVSPGAHLGGRVHLGHSAFVATGAIVLSRLSVGAGSIVAAGSLVTHDVPERVLVMGAPARVRTQVSGEFDWKKVL